MEMQVEPAWNSSLPGCLGLLANLHIITHNSCLCVKISNTLCLCVEQVVYGEIYDWSLIEEASATDRSGSAVLEYLIIGNSQNSTIWIMLSLDKFLFKHNSMIHLVY
jgi:hypothetical protein